jgi:hypothetical protein
MSFEFYKLLHVVSVIVVLFALGGLTAATKAVASSNGSKQKIFSILHGIGLAVILVSGFGMLARLGLVGEMPDWVKLKIGAWLVIGSFAAVYKRKPHWAYATGGLALFIAFCAAHLGLFKLA